MQDPAADCDHAAVIIDTGAVLRAHDYMRIERPSRLWKLSADDETFFRLLGEAIAHGLSRGNELGELTLKADNIVVETDDLTVPGDYVGITVVGPAGDWFPEQRWPVDPATTFVNSDLHLAARGADLIFGYTRAYPDGGGSVTLYFPATPGRS
jgi:hypothetical protein